MALFVLHRGTAFESLGRRYVVAASTIRSADRGADPLLHFESQYTPSPRGRYQRTVGEALRDARPQLRHTARIAFVFDAVDRLPVLLKNNTTPRSRRLSSGGCPEIRRCQRVRTEMALKV